MKTRLETKAMYSLPIVDVLEYTGMFEMNGLVGHTVSVKFMDDIRCVETGKKIKKTFGEGMSYEAFLKSPLAVESIIRPELSRIHEGIALRDKVWEEAHHNQPHFVYLSRTSDIKVGVTRTGNIPSRWIDQGAVEAIILAETPYRQLAGLIEVLLKEFMPDKTSWQSMLKNIMINNTPLLTKKNEVLELLPADYEQFIYDDDTITAIDYPVMSYPEKVKSLKLDTTPQFTGRLSGIKGQYLIFDDGRVFNVRAHAAHKVMIEF